MPRPSSLPGRGAPQVGLDGVALLRLDQVADVVDAVAQGRHLGRDRVALLVQLRGQRVDEGLQVLALRIVADEVGQDVLLVLEDRVDAT